MQDELLRPSSERLTGKPGVLNMEKLLKASEEFCSVMWSLHSLAPLPRAESLLTGSSTGPPARPPNKEHLFHHPPISQVNGNQGLSTRPASQLRLVWSTSDTELLSKLTPVSHPFSTRVSLAGRLPNCCFPTSPISTSITHTRLRLSICAFWLGRPELGSWHGYRPARSLQIIYFPTASVSCLENRADDTQWAEFLSL